MARATRFEQVVGQAQMLRRAVAALTCYNLEQLEAVIRAAEARRAPAIVLISPSSFTSLGGERLVRGFKAMAKDSTVDILLQLDHVSEASQMEQAAACGVDAVMADRSKLPFSDNLALTRDVTSSMHNLGIGVEAELGRVEGQEDRTGDATTSGEMTDVSQAERFARETGVDCLAVAVGNVHGHYSGTPQLDWQRLENIQEACPVPLSLHGASGLPEADLDKAISTGICKINVNTELRAAYFERLGKSFDLASQKLDLKGLSEDLTEAIHTVVQAKLSTLGWTDKEAQ